MQLKELPLKDGFNSFNKEGKESNSMVVCRVETVTFLELWRAEKSKQTEHTEILHIHKTEENEITPQALEIVYLHGKEGYKDKPSPDQTPTETRNSGKLVFGPQSFGQLSQVP